MPINEPPAVPTPSGGSFYLVLKKYFQLITSLKVNYFANPSLVCGILTNDMEHNKHNATVIFNDTELAVMPGMVREIDDQKVPHVQEIVHKLGNQCIQELIGTGTKSPLFSDKAKSEVLQNKLALLHNIYEDLENIEPEDQLVIPGTA